MVVQSFKTLAVYCWIPHQFG